MFLTQKQVKLHAKIRFCFVFYDRMFQELFSFCFLAPSHWHDLEGHFSSHTPCNRDYFFIVRSDGCWLDQSSADLVEVKKKKKGKINVERCVSIWFGLLSRSNTFTSSKDLPVDADSEMTLTT